MAFTEKQLNNLPQTHGFRLRGTAMTRLETFTDAAFAFATTLLVISVGTIPDSYAELITALKGVPAFAACFALVANLWVAHHRWSRRYGLEDATSVVLTLIMIFTMLVYVYPLKMIFSALFSWISGGWLPGTYTLEKSTDLINLFIIYGLGFTALTMMFAFLYIHALRVADQLKLNELERLRTREDIWSSVILAGTGFASAIFAWVMPIKIGIFAGFIYMNLPVMLPILAVLYERKIKKLK
jgi:uncharacterized membrane protein